MHLFATEALANAPIGQPQEIEQQIQQNRNAWDDYMTTICLDIATQLGCDQFWTNDTRWLAKVAANWTINACE